MRYAIMGSFLVGGLILESTVLNYLKVAGVKPDLLLVFVIFTAILHGHFQGAKIGFVFGLVEDLFLGKYLGLNALSKMLTGYLIGLGENKVFKDNLFIPVIGLFSATLFNNFVYVLLAGLAGVKWNLAAYVWDVTIPEAIYNACLAPLFYGKFYHAATKGSLKVGRY